MAALRIERDQRRRLGDASVDPLLAARHEPATGLVAEQHRRAAGIGRRRMAHVVEARHEPEQRRVYGCSAASRSSATGPRSTIRPAYMTCTLSQIAAITPRSWLITIIAMPEIAPQLGRAGRGSAPGW